MTTPDMLALFVDGVVSVAAMCFRLIIPFVLPFALLLAWNRFSERKESVGKELLFLAAITLLLLDGIYIVYLALSYPKSGFTHFYLEYRKETGVAVGIILLALFGFQCLNAKSGKGSPPWLPFVSSALFGLLVTATWAPCIRETVATISLHESGRFPLFLSYVSGLTLPFLFLSCLAFSLRLVPVSGAKVVLISTIGIISLILLSLLRILL